MMISVRTRAKPEVRIDAKERVRSDSSYLKDKKAIVSRKDKRDYQLEEAVEPEVTSKKKRKVK
jgi:hypothetical protein